MTLTIRIERARDGWWTASLGDYLHVSAACTNPLTALRHLVKQVEEFNWLELAETETKEDPQCSDSS